MPAPASDQEPLITAIEFTTTLSVDDCLLRLNASHRKRVFGSRRVEVVTNGTQFTISTLPHHRATCHGELIPASDGTRITAQAQLEPDEAARAAEPEGCVLARWGVWFVSWGILLGLAARDDVLRDPWILLMAALLITVPVALHAVVQAENRRERREVPDFARWLYRLLFET